MNASFYSSSYRTHTTSAGFTLIELMITIAVLAIIVSIAAPNISNQLANQRVKSTASILANALKEAKVESLVRRQTMTIAYDNNGTSAGTITIEDPSANVVATYTYNANSTIKDNVSGSDAIDFKSDKTADAIIYTVCDSNLMANPRQIEVSAIATLINQAGGVCP